MGQVNDSQTGRQNTCPGAAAVSAVCDPDSLMSYDTSTGLPCLFLPRPSRTLERQSLCECHHRRRWLICLSVNSMSSISVFLVGGARPNFMKVAAVYKAIAASPKFCVTLVHTGQHYDEGLSDVFFRDLDLPQPDIRLEVGSESHGVQTARILERFEKAVVEGEPDLVIVVGDVNSTIACALAAVKIIYPLGRRPKVAHVEAGLRSFDRTMPEEINRVLTDAISDFLFTTEESAGINLAREGVPANRVFFVGNVMIDTLLEQAQRAAALRTWEAFGLKDHGYAILTYDISNNDSVSSS